MTISFLQINKSFLYLLVVSFFFPIIPLVDGLRFDQIILYFIFLFDLIYIFLFPSRFKFSLNKILIPFLLLLILITSFFATILNYKNFTSENIAPLENILNPLALSFILYLYFSFEYTNSSHIRGIINVSIYFIIFNSLFSLLSIFIDVSELMSYFVSNDNGNSVWQRSYQLSRYIGFFSQPIEAGFAYSTCLLLFIRDYKNESSIKYIFFQSIIIIGGIISTSKVFYITIILIIILRLFNYRKYYLLALIIILSPFFLKYFDLALVYFLATRYLETSNFVDDLLFIYNNNFLIGLGFNSTVSDNPIDNAYLQILILSGVIGIIFYFIILYKMVPQINLNKKISSLNSIYFILIFLGGIGSPILTLNKANFFIFLFSFINFKYLRYNNL